MMEAPVQFGDGLCTKVSWLTRSLKVHDTLMPHFKFILLFTFHGHVIIMQNEARLLN